MSGSEQPAPIAVAAEAANENIASEPISSPKADVPAIAAKFDDITLSSVTATLHDLNPVPVVEEMINELGKLQHGKNKPTFVRGLAAEVRNALDDWRGQFYELKSDLIKKSKEAKAAPSNFVAENAMLHSAFLVKMCQHQPNVLIVSVTMATALPTAMINKKFGFFSGLIGGAVAYGFVQITNAQNGATAGSNSSPKVVNAATTVIKSAK